MLTQRDPRLLGRTIALRAIVASDYPLLYQMATTPPAAITWRLRGRSVSPEAFSALLWSDCLAQFVIEDRNAQWSTLGLISAFNHDPISRTAYLSVLIDPSLEGATTALAEAVVVFSRHLNTAFSLRKLYAETTELSLPAMDRMLATYRFVHEEGCLTGHFLIDNRFIDVRVLALHIDELMSDARVFDAYLDGEPGRPSGSPNFVDFCDFLREGVGVDIPPNASGGTLLKDDLAFDSITLFECVIALEEQYGLEVPDQRLPVLVTLQDLYALTVELATVRTT